MVSSTIIALPLPMNYSREVLIGTLQIKLHMIWLFGQQFISLQVDLQRKFFTEHFGEYPWFDMFYEWIFVAWDVSCLLLLFLFLECTNLTILIICILLKLHEWLTGETHTIPSSCTPFQTTPFVSIFKNLSLNEENKREYLFFYFNKERLERIENIRLIYRNS